MSVREEFRDRLAFRLANTGGRDWPAAEPVEQAYWLGLADAAIEATAPIDAFWKVYEQRDQLVALANQLADAVDQIANAMGAIRRRRRHLMTRQEIESHRILGHLSDAQAAQAVPDCDYCGRPDCDQREIHARWNAANETTWWRAAS